MGAPGPPGPLGSKGREVGHYGLVGNISLIELNRFAPATRRHNRITTQWHNGIIASFGDENLHTKTWGRSHCFLIPLCSCCHVAFFTMSHGNMPSISCLHVVVPILWCRWCELVSTGWYLGKISHFRVDFCTSVSKQIVWKCVPPKFSFKPNLHIFKGKFLLEDSCKTVAQGICKLGNGLLECS